MSKLSSVNFTPLTISGSNYLPWTLDAEMYLQSEGLENCIVQGNAETNRNKASALVKLRHHLHEDLKHEY
ncbi:hypothetical protein ACHQM5_010411 [Ranunculus cassubicifolius]